MGRNRLVRISLSCLLILCIAIAGNFGFSAPAQALDLETQQYFIKHIQKDKILSVSPNFRGDLTQASLITFFN